MPTEQRRIIFADDEIVSASLSHCRLSGIALPDADVEDLDIALDTDCSIRLTFAVESPDLPDEVLLDPDTVMNALIGYCRLRSIPLPRVAVKRLEPVDGALSMVFDMHRRRGSVCESLAA